MNEPETDQGLEAAAERLVKGQRAHPAPPGAAGDPRAHQVAAALAGQRRGREGAPAGLQRRVASLVSRELAQPSPVAGPAAPGHGSGGAGLTRRQWLTGTGAALAAGVAGIAVGELAARAPARTPPTTGGHRRESTLVPSEGIWRPVAAAERVVAGAAIPFVAGAVTGMLVRDPSGRILALSAICTHLGCRVRWVPASRQFLCPCHGASFTATGTFAGGPWGTAYPGGLPPLPRLRSRVTPDGMVEVLTAD